MGRYSSSSAYGFRCVYITDGAFRISWTVDFYYADSRLRYPRVFSRITDSKGAERFCKKHLLPLAPTEEVSK